MVSKFFIRSVRNSGQPVYKVARKAGIHPGSLYKILIGHDDPKYGDMRVLKVAALLNINLDDCWDQDEVSRPLVSLSDAPQQSTTG
jgi:hypothetical protein